MAQIETWLNQDMMQAVKVRYLDGNLFSQDNAGNLIGVKLTRDGEDYSGGGTVSANVIRADGGTVAVSGALSGNAATVVLPQAAYAVPGVVSIVVKLTVSGAVTTIAAVVANIYQSSTETAIDPGTIIPSIQTLINQISTAVASIPADYSSLWATLAPAFSTSTAYTAGQYVTYNGGLYRFTANHAAGVWSSSDVSAVVLGNELSDLKNEFDSIHPTKTIATGVGSVSRVAFNIKDDGTMGTTGNSIILPIDAGYPYDISTSDRWGSNYALLTNNTLVSGSAPSYATGYTGKVMISQNQKINFTASNDAKYIIIRCDSDAGQNAISLIEYVDISKLQNAVIETKTFDLSGYDRANAFINASNLWEGGGNVNKTAFIPTVPGQKLIIKTTYQYGSVYALLKDDSLTIGSAPNFCTGYAQRYQFSKNTLVNLDIPSDCHYLAVRADAAAADSTFEIKTQTQILDLVEDVSDKSKRINLGTNIVYVAASNSTENDKACADFVCTGTNDEVTIQNAIGSIQGVKSGGSVVLMSGDYYIDSFPNTNYDGHVAIMLPSKQASDTIGTNVYAMQIKGNVYNAENVCIHVTQDAYDAMNTTDFYSVFAAQNDWYYNHYSFHDLRVFIPSSQKKIVCYDGRRMGSMECRRLKAIVEDHATWDTPIEEIVLPIRDCIGVAGACWDSNSWNYIWESIYCIGFGQGFAVGGEHLLAIKCVAIYGRYGFTFHANMDASKISQNLTPSHPDTLIDCSDEGNANFWLFGGNNTRKPVINCYNLSIEHWENWFSLEGQGHYATEETPGQFRGYFSYAHVGGNVSKKWWATDGSGQGFTTVNLNQERTATSERRALYAPNIGQEVYDTTLNKLCICTNPATKEWRDAMGNVIT